MDKMQKSHECSCIGRMISCCKIITGNGEINEALCHKYKWEEMKCVNISPTELIAA